ncbi:MAG: hypothetical protein ABFS14_10590 [Gemmatimonadota bacterium]
MRCVRFILMLLAFPAAIAAQGLSEDQWRQDLRVFAEGLESRHPNLYHTVPEPVFRAGVDSLAAQAGSLDDNEITVELARLLATVGDGHTLVNLLWDRQLFFRRLPVRIDRAEDGLLVVEASADFMDLIGARVLRVGRVTAEDAFDAVRPFMSHDNEWTPLMATDLLQVPEILQATGISPAADSVALQVRTASGEQRNVVLPATAREALGPLHTGRGRRRASLAPGPRRSLLARRHEEAAGRLRAVQRGRFGQAR